VVVLAPPDLDLSLPPALCYQTGPGGVGITFFFFFWFWPKLGGDLGSRGGWEAWDEAVGGGDRYIAAGRGCPLLSFNFFSSLYILSISIVFALPWLFFILVFVC
jgi:hypothetical protein